jgi:uncharacterized membrane protein YeaQ/YmgE (transglycosylase-associated protein family)
MRSMVSRECDRAATEDDGHHRDLSQQRRKFGGKDCVLENDRVVDRLIARAEQRYSGVGLTTPRHRFRPERQSREVVMSSIIWIIVIGFIAGIIARILYPGPNSPSGFILTTALGIAGAFIATFLGQTIGWYRLDQGAGFIGATVGALIVLFIWNRLAAHRVVRDPGMTADPSAPPTRRWL